MNDVEIQGRLERIEHRLNRERYDARRTRTRLSRGLAGVGLLAVTGLPLVAYTYPDAPHGFQAGDPISAAEMNENFQHVTDGVSMLEGQVTPIGSIVVWAGGLATIPSGWLPCDGTEYTSATYPDLATAIGSAHGGDGATSFFVPDFRGRFLRGVDEGTGRDPDAASRTQPQDGSGNAGDGVGSVQSDAFAAHAHGTAINFPFNVPGAGAFGTGSHGVFDDVMFGASNGSVNAQNSSLEGGAESRPVNVYVHFIIRAE